MTNIDTILGVSAPSSMAVTLERKRYSYVMTCGNCGLLFQAERADALTCLPRCRVAGHRSGRLRHLKSIADSMRIPASMILRARALELLCPDLCPQVRDGALSLDDVRGVMWSAFWEKLEELARGKDGDHHG